MSELELDDWFFNLPAVSQMDITAIFINEDTATEGDYLRFDLAVSRWWDNLDLTQKLAIYKNETK